jgi:succinyl-CoA synthetase beta subunit
MARLFEYQGKELLKKYNINVPPSVLISRSEEIKKKKNYLSKM